MLSMLPDRLPDSGEADHDLLLRVKWFLHQRGYGPHRTLALSAERGVVVIQGRVPTYHLRQVAIECAKHVAAVTQIIDRIEVVYVPDDEPVTSYSSTEQRADLPTLSRTARATPRPHVRRSPLSPRSLE